MFNTADRSMPYMKASPGVKSFILMLPFLTRPLALGAFGKYENINDMLRAVTKEGKIKMFSWR